MMKTKFGSLLLLCQGIFVILFVVFVDDSNDTVDTKLKNGAKNSYKNNNNNINLASGFQNLHISTFLGFGLIMTFLRRYSRGMLVHVFLIGTVVIQWATLLQGFFTMTKTKIDMNIMRMINADYAVIAVLVSMGAIMGKCNSLQLLIIGMVETFFFSVNEAINLQYLKVSDFGRSMTVHVFGAYFGLAVSKMIYCRKVCMSRALSMSYKSEMYTFIGTLFLWAYWPSVNASFVDSAAQNRALANTFYALAASCTASFSFTVLQSKEGKFNIFHLQNATIAGGIAIGSIAGMSLTPWGAVIVGIVGALGSILGYKSAVPSLRRALKIHDTRGIQAVHGIPGILSGIASILVALLANEESYGSVLYKLYPARSPMKNTTKLMELQQFASIPPGEDRTASFQALFQLACLGITLVLAISGGLVTGLIIRLQFFDPVSVNDAFDDHDDFEERNCIDVSYEIEFEDEEEEGKHHDVVVAGERRLKSNSSTPLQSEQNLVPNHKHESTNDVELEVLIDKGETDETMPLVNAVNGQEDNEGPPVQAAESVEQTNEIGTDENGNHNSVNDNNNS